MIFSNEEQIFAYLKANKTTPVWVDDARAYHRRLLALIDGEGFKEHLIEHIEHLESAEKAASRKKYARNVADLFERVLRLTDNIYSSTGGTKQYNNLSDEQSTELKSHLSDIKGGRTLEAWLENTWLKTYHTDPNGIVYLEYDALLGIKPQPCYKSINSIRNYHSNGRKLEVLLFEPQDLEDGSKKWGLVDDKKYYTVIQKGENFAILEEECFEHEFGCVPALINSEIEHIGYTKRLSPLDKVIELAEKYARDLSVKNVYQQLAGFPRRWSYASSDGSSCPSCHGLGQNGEEVCGVCNGTGTVQVSKDVTTEDILEIPEDGQASIVPASGYVSPDLAFLADARIELKELEDLLVFTHWGAVVNTEAVATATEIVVNTQPIIKRLNKYADQAEFMESMLTEMIANNMFLSKDKSVKTASILLGRNYIIESTSVVLERYEAAKAAGDNTIVLDRLYQEYLLTKYKTDEVGLQIAMVKSKVEPYIHFTAEQVLELIGTKEAQRKVLFSDWWKTLTGFDKDAEQMRVEYDAWFDSKYEKPTAEEVTAE